MDKDAPLSVLITAGGTAEAIDTVRSITNHSTGRLGSLIADAFIQNGDMVTYLCGEASFTPSVSPEKTIKIRDTAELSEILEKLLKQNKYDCIIHSMAVSDFTPCAVTTLDEIIRIVRREINNSDENELSARIRNAIVNTADKASKISSDNQDLILALKPTPKVIGQIKRIQPAALLVGFKLLSGAGETELIEAGRILIEKNDCDFVLANDLKDISADKHRAFLMDKDRVLRRASTKDEIARMILECVTERLKRE